MVQVVEERIKKQAIAHLEGEGDEDEDKDSKTRKVGMSPVRARCVASSTADLACAGMGGPVGGLRAQPIERHCVWLGCVVGVHLCW